LTLDKRYREKSGKKYREFIKVLKKKSSKKEDSQDIDCDNPSSTFNTHLEENHFTNLKKGGGIDSNLSVKSNDSLLDFKKDLENLIFMRVNSPASSNKNIISKLETMKKKINEEGKDNSKFYEVNIIISYRQLVNEVVPFLKNFLKHNNSEISKKAKEVLNTIKEKVLAKVFMRVDRIDSLCFEFNLDSFDVVEIGKMIDNTSKSGINSLEKPNLLCEKVLTKNSNDSSSLNDYSSDAPQDFLVECLFKREKKKQKLNIFPLTQQQTFLLIKDIVETNCSSEEFFKTLNSEADLDSRVMSVPENKKILRKNICIQLLNILEKVMADFEISVIKKLVILLELKMREKDQNMCEVYQESVKNFFSSVKSFYQEQNTLAYKEMNNY
jgi:hypothetical protein